MDRISTATKAVDLFGAGKHGWKDGNIAGGIVPTDFNAEWVNGAQEELLAIIEAAGIAPAAATRNQVLQAIDIMVRKQAGLVCVAAGTADAITGDFTPDVTALTAGMRVSVRAGAANATTTPSFKADATALKTIVKGNNLPLVAGDIAGAGHWIELKYDLTNDNWVLQNPAAGLGVTPPQFDNSTKVATTAFVQLALGNFSGRYNASVTQILTAANSAGKIVNSNGVGVTLTLPLSDSVPAGAVICFENDGPNITIARQAGDFISTGQSSAASFILKTGDTLIIESNALGTWRVVGGSGQLPYSNLFGSSITNSGYQKLPSGLIIQWADGVNQGASGNQVINFPIAFPNAVLNFQVTNLYANAAQNGGYGAITATSTSVTVARNNADNAYGVTPRVIVFGY